MSDNNNDINLPLYLVNQAVWAIDRDKSKVNGEPFPFKSQIITVVYKDHGWKYGFNLWNTSELVFVQEDYVFGSDLEKCMKEVKIIKDTNNF